MKTEDLTDLLAGTILTPVIWLIGMLVMLPFGFVWMVAWNSSVALIFGWPHIDYWQAYWLSVLLGVAPLRLNLTRHS